MCEHVCMNVFVEALPHQGRNTRVQSGRVSQREDEKGNLQRREETQAREIQEGKSIMYMYRCIHTMYVLLRIGLQWRGGLFGICDS